MLSTLAFLTLVLGAVLLLFGYLLPEPRAVRPGWACVVIAVVLFLAAYLAPALHASSL